MTAKFILLAILMALVMAFRFPGVSAVLAMIVAVLLKEI